MSDTQHRRGLGLAIAAYGTWGIVPVFWKQLRHTPAIEQLVHRVFWALIAYLILMVAMRKLGDWKRALAVAKNRRILGLTSLLIAINWFLYVYAVEQSMLLQASLGYFINPIVNIVLGMVFLGERLRPAQKFAVAMALVGIALLASRADSGLWLSLCLAASFGIYGLIRKVVKVEALEGASTEALFLAPACLAYICWLESHGTGHFFAGDTRTTLLLMFAGVVTALPLLWFAGAARRIPLTTLGFVQYLAPTGQFLLAVFVYDEVVATPKLIAFCLIWLGLLTLVLESLRNKPSARTIAAINGEPAS